VLKDYFETEKKTENIELIKNTPLLDQEQLFVQLRKSNDSTFLGQDKLTIDKETWQPLPSLKGDKNPCFYKPSITHLENIQGVILGYEKETGLHYVKLDKNFKRDSKTVSLHYLLDTNPHDLSKDSTYEFKKSPTNESLEKLKIIKESLSTSSIDSLESDISAPNKYNDFLNFLEIITTEKDLIPLIEHIKKYFKHFKNEDLEKDLNLSFLAKQLGLEPTALLILTQRKGACRHRANALAYLFDLLGFKNVCIEKNDVHSFISFYDESTESHLTLDLGGHPCTLDLKPFEIKKKVVIPPKTENPDDENIHANPFKTETAKTIDEFWESRLSTKKAQLMWAESSLSARSIYTSLLKHLKENKSPLEGHTLYIDSAESLQQLLSDISINNDGTYKKVIGPLAKLIEGAKKTGQPALLLINWAQFSAKDIALYKSMMDDIRKIGPLLLPDCVQILGVTSPEAPKTDAFLSRIQEDKHVLFPLALLQAKEISKETKAPTDCLEINLFNSPDWRSHLLGRIGIDGKKFIWNDGLLTKAIKEKKSIVIKNPPQNNKEFDLFVYQLLNERKFQINGEEINVTDSFNIPYENKPYLFDTKNISFSITESLKDTYYLNQSTFSQFLQYIHINTKGEGENVDGYLAQYKDGDIIKVTETLSDAQWAQLLDAIEKKKTDFKFQFMISGGVTMPEAFNVKATELKNAENLDILESPKHSFFATSSDPGYTTQLLQEKLNIPSGNVIHLSKKMSQSDFFECISVTMESEKGLSFHRELRPVYEKLKKGESVILSGSCSQTLYNQLSSLFGEPPGIWLNGEYHTLPGKLIIISPEKNALKTATHFKHVVPLSEYKRYFENKYSAEDIGKAYTFFDLMQKLPPITDKSGPSTPVITAQRFKMLLEALKNNKNSPAKQIILHDYRGESYVIRNVLAKLIFSDKKHEQKINTEKLKSLLEDMPAGNYSDANLFKLMNCFSGNIIRDNFLNYKDFPKISEEEKLNFHSVINSLFPKNNPSELKALVPAQSSFKLNPVEKRQHLLEDAIDHPEHKIIFLKGGPGTGKTHTLSSQLKNITDVTLYNSEDALEKFLEDKNTDSKKIILFLDEANINPEDYWNLLKGLKKSPPSVFYKGKIYPLTQEHKIVLTGNPEDFTNRNYLDIQDITYTIGFRPLRIDFLKKEIVAPLLKKEKFTFDTTISSELMLRAYHDLQTCMPYRTFSARDIESMVIRYIKLCKNKNPEEEEQAQRRIACIAIAETFRKHFETEEKLLEWINKLADTTFSLSDIALVKQRVEIKTDESYVVVPSRQKIIDSIHFNIDMLKTEGKGKRGILLEGPSGVGKSALALYCLKNENKEIVHINAGEEDDETITEKLIDALHEGKFVILDEYNIKPLEHILNHILSGVDPDGNPAKKPGFYIILTGNPATTHQGHKELSEAELNRLDIEHVKPHTHQELCEIAKIKYGIEEKQASALIKEAKKTFWSTDRSSFYAFEKYAEEHPEKLKEKKPELTENFSPLKKE
jgi:DNA replication protein DnaC